MQSSFYIYTNQETSCSRKKNEFSSFCFILSFMNFASKGQNTDALGITKVKMQTEVFSSPEPKAQVSSYCRPFSSVVVVRRASSVNFLHFHLLLENALLDFNQTWQESSLGVGDSKLFKSYVWPPWGPRGRAPKGQNHANFKHLLLQIQKENGEVI